MESILTTKLHIPAAHPNRVSRPHLIDKLDENLWQVQGKRFLRRLTLVAAPAGYGKSTLLYDWVDHLRIPVAWIGFDENDNEPERFFQYLIASLQKIQPGLGETYQSVLQSPQSWYISEIATNIMASLLNELAAISQPFLLVFDDYHTMQNQAIHQAVKLLLDHLPENLSVVIATRADPPIALSRLRARRQMVEVRANDLRFSESEAGPFLRQVMQVDLRDQEILSLTKSTEGWIAGLQMAALALQGRVDPIAFIHDFNGRQRFILDYLFEEVFSQQPEVVQTFLIQTSILERMNASLCEVLMGNSTGGESFQPISSVSASMSGQQFLEYLERFNLFIIPLDHQREWFRYHHLFTDLLRHHLRNTRSVEYIAGLYEQASRWCENQGFNDEAMHYAALSGSQEQLAKLVEISGNTLVQSGQTAQRPRLIRLLSVETLRSNPGLCVECAWSEILVRQSPDLRQAEVYLQMAEQGVAENSDCVSSTGYPVAYRVVHTRAILSRFKGDAPETVIALTKKALELLPNDDYAYRCSLYQNLGMAYLAVANLEEALKNLQQSWEEARASGMSYVAIAATYMLCRCLQTQGRLDEMENLLRTALADFEQSESESRRIIPALGILYIVQAWLLLEQAGSREKMDTAAVEQAVKKGLERCALTAEQYAFAEGLALKARLLAAQGDLLGAYNCLEEMEAEIPGTASYCAAIRIRLMLAQNDNDARIELFAGRLPSKLDDWVYPVAVPPIVWHWEEQMGLVRLMIGRKRQSTAADLVPVLSYLDRKIEACTSAGWQMQRIELHLLKALALDADQNTSSAAEELAQAQVAAETHGFYRLLVEEGEPFADLLHRVHNRLPSTPLLHRLIVSLGLDDKLALHANPVNHPAKERSRAGLVDPLTEREFEVLKLIAGGFSNKEIAEKLVVTIGTVKAHTSNIYRKLDVPGRTKALAKAREIHLI